MEDEVRLSLDRYIVMRDRLIELERRAKEYEENIGETVVKLSTLFFKAMRDMYGRTPKYSTGERGFEIKPPTNLIPEVPENIAMIVKADQLLDRDILEVRFMYKENKKNG